MPWKPVRAASLRGRAVEEQVLLGLESSRRGCLRLILYLSAASLMRLEEVLRAGAGAHGAVEQGLGPVGDGLGGVEVVDAAEAVALGAGAVVGVEGEAARLELGDVDAAVRGRPWRRSRGSRSARAAAGSWMAIEDEAVGHLQGFGDGCFEAAGVVAWGVASARARALALSGLVWVSGQTGLRMMRSTTASMVWFLRFSRRMPSVSSVISPSMRARKPCWSRASSSSRNSPLRPRTMGAKTVMRSLGGGRAPRCARRSARRTGG